MPSTEETVVATIAVVSSLLHIAGIYLLVLLRRSRISRTQRCYLLHLNLAELLLSISTSVYTLRFSEHEQSEHSAFEIIESVVYSTLYLMWYMNMCTLTVDRFMAVYLSFKYPIYWSARKANILCVSQWILCTATGGVVMILEFVAPHLHVIDDVFLYAVPMVLDWLFIAIVFLVYGFIFIKYRQSVKSELLQRASMSNLQRTSGISSRECSDSQSILSITRGYKFWVPTLIIGIFLVLVVVPDQIFADAYIYSKDPRKYSDVLLEMLEVPFCIGRASNAIICMALLPPVRALLLRKLRNLGAKMRCRPGQRTMEHCSGTDTNSQTFQDKISDLSMKA